MEWDDFQTLWEQRLLVVAAPFLDPAPELVEGSRVGQFQDGAAIVATVIPGAENPPRSGFFECEVIIEYDYGRTKKAEPVSTTWGQILEAFGDGRNGDDELRTRLASGRLVIPGGIDAIRYDRSMADNFGDSIKEFRFSAHLGITSEIGA